MKAGSMIFSLVTLCVVMLFMEGRISRFLHGEPEPVHNEASLFDKVGPALAGFWADLTDLVPFSFDAGNSEDEKVVITEDTVKQVWVWQEQGTIQSARSRPDRGDASQVMIPRDMTAEQFFADPGPAPSGNSAHTRSGENNTGGPEPEQGETKLPSSVSDSGARDTLEQMSPEQRRALLEQGMEVLQRQGPGRGATPGS